MLESIKLALRIKSSAFDEEISDLIQSAEIDLKISGIINAKEDDPLIRQAIKTYCKANFGLDNKYSEKHTVRRTSGCNNAGDKIYYRNKNRPYRCDSSAHGECDTASHKII